MESRTAIRFTPVQGSCRNSGKASFNLFLSISAALTVVKRSFSNTTQTGRTAVTVYNPYSSAAACIMPTNSKSVTVSRFGLAGLAKTDVNTGPQIMSTATIKPKICKPPIKSG